jgi:type IV fimbrial biogenesis protein FimT
MRAQVLFFQKKHTAGFTLVEFMVVLAIAAILFSMAVPSFRALIRNMQVTTVVNDFFSALNLARSEAIKRGTRVTLGTVKADSGWEDGWVVFVHNNSTTVPDAGDEIIFERGPIHRGITIVPNLGGDPLKYISFNGTGRTRTDDSGQTPLFGNFAFIVDGVTVRQIIITFLGRPRVCTPAKKDCD